MTVTTNESLIERLCDPSLFPHPCERIEVIETHISWVLLTGLRAYKIKKPVALGFVDFTTLDRRRRFCYEELRLNRRLAPDLYLDVVPITGSPDVPRIGGDGDAIEYAVRMLQFHQDYLLSRMMERDEVTAEHVDQLAQTVAGFHERIAVADPDSEHGSLKDVFEPAAENFEHLLRLLDEPKKRVTEELQEWSMFQFERIRDVFVARKREGMIRECHGDMHLGNMFLHNGVPTVFDSIEFNDSLRWIDVMSEVAFVVMDLEDRGRPDLARRFLNTWLEYSGDYAGLRVLPFYLVYRALVRAKVDAIRMDQGHLDRTEWQHLNDDCAGYLELASRYTTACRPMLMITTGPSGSGKTTGTQDVVERFGAVRVRSDVERKRMHGLGPLESSHRQIYSAEDTERTYDRLAELATNVIDAGYPAVVDATFLQRDQRDRFRRLAHCLSVPFLILQFAANEDVLRERVRARQLAGHDASEAGLKILERQLELMEAIHRSEDEHTVDAVEPFAVVEKLSGLIQK